MKHLIALLTLLTLSVTAYAEPLKVDVAYGVAYQPSTLKLQYPDVNDSERRYLAVFATGNDLTRIRSWFNTNEELKRLKSQCHYCEVDSASVMFNERYAATTPRSCIRLQESNGRIVKDFQPPMSAESFIRAVNSSNCLRRNYPQPTPNTDPPPQPIVIDTPAPPKPRFPWLFLGLVSSIAAGGGAFYQWSKSNKK